MNIDRIIQNPNPNRTGAANRVRSPARPAHRERDFGIGYGNSSGYGQDRRYADSGAKPMFRCG
jgi:hypothetical protein